MNEADEHTRIHAGFEQLQNLAIARYRIAEGDLHGVACAGVKVLVEVGELDEDWFALMKRARCHKIQRAGSIQYFAARIGRIGQRRERFTGVSHAAPGGPRRQGHRTLPAG